MAVGLLAGLLGLGGGWNLPKGLVMASLHRTNSQRLQGAFHTSTTLNVLQMGVL